MISNSILRQLGENIILKKYYANSCLLVANF